MFSFKNKSTEEFIDQYLQIIALGVLLVSLAFAISAALHLVDPSVAKYLRSVKIILGISAMVLVLPGYVYIFSKLTQSERRFCLHSEGYIAEIFKKSCAKAFELTFVFLVMLNFVTRNWFSELPTEFFIQLLTFLSLGAFSIKFFTLNRSGSGSDFEIESEK